MKKVLVVEDNKLNIKLFNDLLVSQGFSVLKAENGLDAMRMVKEHIPDLVLLDMQLPGASGLDVVKEIKGSELTKKIPVVAVTAFAIEGDEEKIRSAGCDDYISKPISIDKFLGIVHKYLN